MSESEHHYELAVIVPAFKADFLVRTFQSLVAQTDQRFGVYVFDDGSPCDIRALAQSALGSRPYSYHRFDINLGGVSITRHWARCVALTHEPWVWLFSDDDVMDPDCIAAVNALLASEGSKTDLLRLDGWVIDDCDRVKGMFPFNIDRETWLEYVYARLMGWRRTFMQQLVFRRATYERAGGFLDLPLGWSADDVATIAFGRRRALRRVPGGRVYWRSSQTNLTPNRSLRVRTRKLQAICLFLQWLRRQLDSPREHLFEEDQPAFDSAMDRFLVSEIMNEGAIAALANWRLLFRTRYQLSESGRLALMKCVAVAGVKDSTSLVGKASRALARNPTV